MQLHIRGNQSHVLNVEQYETVAEIKVNYPRKIHRIPIGISFSAGINLRLCDVYNVKMQSKM